MTQSQQSIDDAGQQAKPMTHAVLSAEQRKKWEDTMSMMVWTAPGFQHILYKLLNAQNNANGEHVAVMSKDTNIAATDGKNIIVNPDSFFQMSLPERVYVLGHEIVHNVYGDVEMLHRCNTSGTVPMHDGTTRKFTNDTMQKSMDARINALLNESRIGKAPKMSAALKTWMDATHPGHPYKVGDPFGHFDKEVKGSDSVLDIYKKYYEEDPDGDKEGPGGGTNPGGFDTLTKPGASTGQNPAQAATQRNGQQWAVEVQAAQTIEQARSQGKMAASLKRMFKEILEPEIPWIEHIDTIINRSLGGGGYDWTQPNLWLGGTDSDDMYFAPSETGFGAGWIVVWGDTSGSRSDKELASNIAELAGILEAVNPRRLTVIWCDADIADGSIVEITDITDLKKLEPVGGGGTDYSPVIKWMKTQDEEPDLFIGFTDGYVSHPDRELPWPTIWASTTDVAYPFGTVVKITKHMAQP